jgi:hypothetical protein
VREEFVPFASRKAEDHLNKRLRLQKRSGPKAIWARPGQRERKKKRRIECKVANSM